MTAIRASPLATRQPGPAVTIVMRPAYHELVTAKTRLTIDLDPEVHAELKDLAETRGTTIQKICILAIKQHLLLGQGIGPDPVLEELWNNEDDAVYDDA